MMRPVAVRPTELVIGTGAAALFEDLPIETRIEELQRRMATGAVGTGPPG